MDPVFGVFVVVFFLVATGAYASWWYSDEQVAKRMLVADRASPIAHLRPGQRVRVTGRVVLEDRLLAPLSQRDCALFLLRVEEPLGKNAWRTVVDREQRSAFWVQDVEGERLRIDPADARLLLKMELRGRCGPLDDADPIERSLLEQHGLPLCNVLGFQRCYRFHEARLDAGERVSAAGQVAIGERDGEVFLTLVAPPDGELLVGDLTEVSA